MSITLTNFSIIQKNRVVLYREKLQIYHGAYNNWFLVLLLLLLFLIVVVVVAAAVVSCCLICS